MANRHYRIVGGSFALTLVGATALGAGCGSSPPPIASQKPMVDASPSAPKDGLAAFFEKDCGVSDAASLPKGDTSVHQGSTIALARTGDHSYAYVADHDRDRLVLVDLTNQTMAATTPTYGSPQQVEVLPDGRVAVTIDNASHLEVFEASLPAKGAAALNRICARKMPAGPYALATSPDGSKLVVTSAWEPSLTEVDLPSFSVARVTKVPRAPRGVLVDASNRAFVSHLVGANLSVVKLGGDAKAGGGDIGAIPLGVRAGSASAQPADLEVMRLGSQAYSLASVEIDRPASVKHGAGGGQEGVPPLNGKAPVAQAQKQKIAPVTPLPSDPPEPPSVRIVVPMVSVDPGAPERPTRYYYGPPPVAGVPKQAPVAVVVDPKAQQLLTTRVVATTGNERSGECFLPRAVASSGHRMFVACLGLDEVLELDGRSADPMRTIRQRFAVAKGPTGIAIDTKQNAAVVFSQFDEEVAVVKLDNSPGVRVHLDGGTSHLDEVGMAGRETFYRSDDPRITAEGLSCSSCHPDGTEDGITWSTPEGLRQTPMLAGRLKGTAPYGWTRNQETLETYITDTCSRLGGSGLGEGDLKELASFIRELPSPPHSDHAPADAARGREVFMAQHCDTCHVAGTSTDTKSYDFEGDGLKYDTPSLKDIGITAPYFHDGRYKTLDDLLSDPNSKMGTITSIPEKDRAPLRAYLETL